jgi:hypothetical protein
MNKALGPRILNEKYTDNSFFVPHTFVAYSTKMYSSILGLRREQSFKSHQAITFEQKFKCKVTLFEKKVN